MKYTFRLERHPTVKVTIEAETQICANIKAQELGKLWRELFIR